MTSALSSFPEFLSSQDLVALGLFSSTDAAYVTRIRGGGPEFIKLNKKVLYPKSRLLRFIETRLINSSPRSTNVTQSS